MTAAVTPTTSRSANTARYALAFGVLAALLLGAVVARLAVGTSGVGWPHHAFEGEVAAYVWQARLFRVALAAVAGAALAISGVALQALLRNPLAEPYILGLTTGAAAGIMAQGALFYYVGWTLGRQAVSLGNVLPMPAWLDLTLSADQAGAMAGALLSMTIVFLAGRRRGLIDPLGLLLTGVVLSTMNGALVMMLNYLVGPSVARDDLARWMMGYLDEGVSGGMIGMVALLTAIGLALLVAAGRSMDVATLTESEAQSLGVNLRRLRALLFGIASVLAAGAVLLAGPMAFVGLICPHLARLMLGPRHGPLVIGAAMAGATLILLSDLASTALYLRLSVGLMPIGIFTAMVGG
ncbi:MAG: FecCD family ABC transporter permease, partial [Phycisphaeraceae bacterium]